MTTTPRGWGRIIVGTRLEKAVSSRFFQVWTDIITRGLSQGDGVLSVRGKVAHKAANDLIRMFLSTEADSLLFLDSDADVEHDIIAQFRNYEPGFDYDILQAFYPRRGWPPSAIWFQKDELGNLMEMFITKDEWLSDVAIAGTHCCLVRREVFEAILSDNDPEKFEWFFYPRHAQDSDEIGLSLEASKLGFRIGATTAIKAGHISEITTTWDTYQQYLYFTGQTALIERYTDLAELVGQYTGETVHTVVAKSAAGEAFVREAWERYDPQTPEQVRAFYGAADNGYLYDLVSWNCQPLFERVIAPLYGMAGQRALVIGGGIGTEADVLLNHGCDEVDVYELPGALRDFLAWRFDGNVNLIDALPDEPSCYDVVSAVDVVEHVHPDEVTSFLSGVDRLLRLGGKLVLHTSGPADTQPQHYDHSDKLAAWLQGYERIGEFLWQKS